MQKIIHQLNSLQLFLTIVVLGLILRVALNTAVDSFDFYAFVMWAKYLTTHSMADVFEFLPDGYTPYPPLYYYVLAFLGHVISFLDVWENKWLSYLIIRLPVFAADIGVAWLIYSFAKKYFSEKSALIGSSFYYLHPVIIYNTSVWGQIDSVVTVLGLGSVSLFIYKKYFFGVGLYILGTITKLQILALLPLIIYLSISSQRITKTIRMYFFWGLLAIVPFLPIVFGKGLQWTFDYFFTIPNWYAYSSVYTYNLWAPFGFIVSDNTKLLGTIQYKYLGIFLFWLVASIILFPLLYKKNRNPKTIMFAAFLLWFDFAFFATRIHSRYLIYSFGFYAPFFAQFPMLGILLSILMVANFILPLNYQPILPLIQMLNSSQGIFIGVLFAFVLFIMCMKKYQKLVAHTS